MHVRDSLFVVTETEMGYAVGDDRDGRGIIISTEGRSFLATRGEQMFRVDTPDGWMNIRVSMGG